MTISKKWLFHRSFQALVLFIFLRYLFNLRWDLVVKVWGRLPEAIWLTIQLTALSLALGLLIAWPLALLRAKRQRKVLAKLADGFVAVFRGTPLIVQVFFLYYGLGGELWMRESILWPIFREAYWCVLIGFTLNTAAYTCEIFRGALVNGGMGEREAAMSLGLKQWQVDWLVWVPAAWRRALPQYGNEMIFMLHGTAIAGLTALNEVFGFTRYINSKYYTSDEGNILAALIYVTLTLTLVTFYRVIERKFMKHMKR